MEKLNMGAIKRQYEDLKEAEYDCEEILKELLEVYSPYFVREKLIELKEELLNE